MGLNLGRKEVNYGPNHVPVLCKAQVPIPITLSISLHVLSTFYNCFFSLLSLFSTDQLNL